MLIFLCFLHLKANHSFVEMSKWKSRMTGFSALSNHLVDLSYMGPQMAFAQELLVKGDLDHIINDLAPDLNQTIRQFEKFNVTEAEKLLKANKVSIENVSQKVHLLDSRNKLQGQSWHVCHLCYLFNVFVGYCNDKNYFSGKSRNFRMAHRFHGLHKHQSFLPSFE